MVEVEGHANTCHCHLRQRQRHANLVPGRNCSAYSPQIVTFSISIDQSEISLGLASCQLSDQKRSDTQHTDSVFVRAHNCRLLKMSIHILVLLLFPEIEYA